MLSKSTAAAALASALILAGCAAATPDPSAGNYHLIQGAWTCQEPDVIAEIEKGARSGSLNPDEVQQHRCALNPVDWPAHVMRVDGRYAYLCDAFSKCTGEAVFCQYALVSDILDGQNHPADPAVLLAGTRGRSLQDLHPSRQAMCPAP